MEIRERVKLSRVMSGYSTIQLAATMGIARTNVVRWEAGIQGLPRGQTASLATTTGVPEKWLRGDELEGMVIARPGRFIPPKTQPKAYSYISAMLPQLTKGARCIAVMEQGDCTWLFVTDKYCLCIVCPDKLKILPDTVCENIMLDSIRYGLSENRGVADLLRKVGLDIWADKVPITEETKSVNIGLQISIKSPTDELTAINIAMAAVEKLRMNKFVVNVTISSDR